MIKKVIGDVCSFDVNIIYNAVSVDPDNPVFSKYLYDHHPQIYEEYLDEINNGPRTEVGEIQLLKTENKEQFIFNGFIWNKGKKLNMIAFVKTLVELHNLAEEYHVSVGFPKNIVESKLWPMEIVNKIIEEVFHDSEIDVYIFS